MAEVNRQFEVRQLLKAYRKGLISDDLFEEQMREIESGAPAASAPARTYRLRKRTFATERELVVRFLDEFRAGESFGGEVFGLWCQATRHPMVRGGLRVIAEREARHGRLLGDRLAELGGRPEVTLPESFRDGARARLASREISDLDKLRDVTRRLADVDAAVQPIRDVIDQIGEDSETRTLLELLIDEETSTIRWLHALEKCLAADGDAAGRRESTAAAGSTASARANGHADAR
ncbi:MAG TPA: hypothetical protein VFD92_12055 [Candidatus Binatia bacterium]|nr:hypothetical protein [Candidatus Binatia bacterium]